MPSASDAACPVLKRTSSTTGCYGLHCCEITSDEEIYGIFDPESLPLSKYILVEHKGKEWVVRTRNPFLVGEVYAGPTAGQISFDLWPQNVVQELSEQEIDKLTAYMARFFWHVKGYPCSHPHQR